MNSLQFENERQTMARGISIPLSISTIPFISSRHYLHRHHRLRLPSLRCFSQCASSSQHAIDMAKYREAFSRRMTMAGLKPHHRIGRWSLTALSLSFLELLFVSRENLRVSLWSNPFLFLFCNCLINLFSSEVYFF